ncbi:MAG: spermidine/putrescine ABC transporter substrate-binding protein [Anaerolineae bacterium]|nr:spermidine/putrescine ABC transporter substrate-binding protein [Anaerolineae bacterium]
MFRKVMLLVSLFLLVAVLPVMAQDSEIKTSWTCPEDVVALVQSLPEGDRVLNWYNWTTYEAEDTRSNFQALCGITVNEDNFGSNEELIAKLRQGNPGYDIVVPTGVVVPQMVREGMLVPLDLSKIPNFANISEALQGPEYDPENMYTIPYQWGTMAIGYNVEAVGKEVTSWEDMWNFGGNVAWIEDPRNMLGFALRLQGFDPNTTNPDEIGAARDYLIDRGGNVRSIAQDDGQEKLLSGEVDMVIEYSGDIFQIIANCEANPEQNCAGKYAYVIPAEGGVRWVDNLAIPTDAPHPEFAHAFIDYILDAQVGADISNYTAYATPNQAAIDQELILPEYLESTVIYPDEATNETLFSTIDLGDEVARLYNDAWLELRTLLGQ